MVLKQSVLGGLLGVTLPPGMLMVTRDDQLSGRTLEPRPTLQPRRMASTPRRLDAHGAWSHCTHPLDTSTLARGYSLDVGSMLGSMLGSMRPRRLDARAKISPTPSLSSLCGSHTHPPNTMMVTPTLHPPCHHLHLLPIWTDPDGPGRGGRTRTDPRPGRTRTDGRTDGLGRTDGRTVGRTDPSTHKVTLQRQSAPCGRLFGLA